MLEDEHNLIVRIKHGDSEAFGLIYDHYMPMIYRFVLVKVGSKEDAEDISHQVFLKAWQNVNGQYSERGFPFSSWLYQIARNSIIDHYRRIKPMSSLEDEENTEELIDHARLDYKIDLKDSSNKILEAIKKLKNIEADVVTMRFIDDLSIKEVALAVGKTEGAVKLIQHRALEKIKSDLKERYE